MSDEKKKQLYSVLAIGAGVGALGFLFRDKLFPKKGAAAAPAASTAVPASPASPPGVPAPQTPAAAPQSAAQPIPLPLPVTPTAPGKATVTTNDPAPAGDLRIMAAPSHASGVAQVGGAEKSGAVDVLSWNAGTSASNNKPAKAGEEGLVWSYVRWPGGSRLPAATGYVPQKYLKLSTGIV